MPRHVDPDSFGFLIADIARLLRAEMDRRITHAGIGLTPGEARVLSHADRAGPVRQNVLAERIGVEAMTVSTYLDRLEAMGLVERRADPDDRRAKLVGVTDAGGRHLAEIAAIGRDMHSWLSQGIEADEWSRLRGGLRIVRDNICAAKALAADDLAREATAS